MSFLDPIPLLYDAAVGEAPFEDALSAITRRFDAVAAFLCIGHPRDGGSGQCWSVNHDVSVFQAAGWGPSGNVAVRGGMVAPVGRSFDRRQVWPDPPAQDDFMREDLAEQGCLNNRTFVPFRDRDLLAGGFVALPDKKDVASITEELDVLVGHIGRALRLSTEVGRHRTIERTLQHALDGLGAGVIVVNTDMEILSANSSADSILAAGDGLSMFRGRLSLAGAARARLRIVVKAVVGLNAVSATSSIAVPRPSGRTPYVIRVFPPAGMGQVAGCASACATLVVSDPAMAPALPDVVHLRAAFGLTHAEAEVARLVPLAESKRVMAERLGVSENTIKTHMSAIRQKAGATNTVELACILDRTVLPAFF